jgi:hypothetical protein
VHKCAGRSEPVCGASYSAVTPFFEPKQCRSSLQSWLVRKENRESSRRLILHSYSCEIGWYGLGVMLIHTCDCTGRCTGSERRLRTAIDAVDVDIAAADDDDADNMAPPAPAVIHSSLSPS